MFKNPLFWLIVVLAFFSFQSLLRPGYFPIHDDLQVSRLYEMDLCFRDRQFPCRWVPDMGYGYGYPLFNYYPPLPYYLGEIFHLVGLSFIDSVKLLFILSLIFSGIFSYLLGKELWGKYGGLVTGAFYLYAPYHAVDVYVRGAMNEFWGLVFFPAIFWAVYKVVKSGKNVFIPVVAIFYALLLLSHNLMALFISPFLALFALFQIYWLKRPKETVLKLFAGALWGVGLASFFTLPVFFEQKLVHIETMFIGYFNFLAHFTNIDQMFLSRFWGYGASTWGPEDGMPFPIGQMHWGGSLISFFVFGYLWFKKKRKDFYQVGLLFLFALIPAFLAHQRSVFIWERLPILASMQFPWRFVGLSVFFASMVIGSFFLLVKESKRALLLALTLSIAVVIYNFSFFKPEKNIEITDREKLFSAKGWNKLQTDAIFDYLPVSAKAPPAAKAPDYPEFVSGGGQISSFNKGTNWQTGVVEAISETEIRLPLYYFPEFKVWVDKKEVEITYDNFLGLVTFKVPEGQHFFEARLTDTSVRRLGNILTVISILLLVGWFGREKILSQK